MITSTWLGFVILTKHEYSNIFLYNSSEEYDCLIINGCIQHRYQVGPTSLYHNQVNLNPGPSGKSIISSKCLDLDNLKEIIPVNGK